MRLRVRDPLAEAGSAEATAAAAAATVIGIRWMQIRMPTRTRMIGMEIRLKVALGWALGFVMRRRGRGRMEQMKGRTRTVLARGRPVPRGEEGEEGEEGGEGEGQ